MVSAMDRLVRTSTRLFWAGLGLVFCVCDLGCAQLESKLWGEPPPMLGKVVDTNERYAQAGGPRAPSPAVIVPPSGIEVSSPAVAQVEEVGAAIKPAESASNDFSTGIDLRPPAPLDSRTDLKIAPTAAGVPNASRILAANEHRTETKPSADPAQIVAEARASLDALTNYQVAMHRQERVNGILQPEEDVVLAVKRSPRSVRLVWPNGPNQGREVLYRSDEPGGQMHVKTPNPALPRLSFAPDSPIVMRNSRHPITEAGFDSLIEGLEGALKDPNSGLTATPLETPSGLDRALQGLVRTTASGESWRVYLDPRTHYPSLVEAVDAKGDLLERYVFSDVRANLPELASADAFNQTARWGPARGLFGRLTQSADVAADSSPR